MNLGENIYHLRTAREMSQDTLAEALNVSRQSVSKWENNMAVPDLERLIEMSKLFGVTLDEMVSDSLPVPGSPLTEDPEPPAQKLPAFISGHKKLLGIWFGFLLGAYFLLHLIVRFGFPVPFVLLQAALSGYTILEFRSAHITPGKKWTAFLGIGSIAIFLYSVVLLSMATWDLERLLSWFEPLYLMTMTVHILITAVICVWFRLRNA